MTIEAIKEAITELPEQERATLAAWLIEQEYDRWDRRMAEDFSPGGRGYHLLEKVNRQVDEGKYTTLEKGLQQKRK